MDSVRVDRWLWAVRMFKTRSLATDACRGGKVRVNGTSAKPATAVRVGDEVEASTPGGLRIVAVTGLIDKRASATVAEGCYDDHSPPPPPKDAFSPPPFTRERGAGRPTKRDRRHLDRLRRDT